MNLKGALATVKVTRPAASNGCCHFDTTKDEFLDACNTCNAAVNDRVSVESAAETEKSQAFVQFGVYMAGFVLGLVTGYYAALLLCGKYAGFVFCCGGAGSGCYYPYCLQTLLR